MTFRVIAGDRLSNALHQYGFTGLGWRYNQTTLAFTNGRNQVQHAGRQVLSTAVTGLQLHALIGEQRRQVFKQDLVASVVRFIKVNLVNFQQGKVTLTVFRWADLACNGIAGAQVKATDLAGRDVNIVRPCQVGSVGRAEEAETVLQNFQYAICLLYTSPSPRDGLLSRMPS